MHRLFVCLFFFVFHFTKSAKWSNLHQTTVSTSNNWVSINPCVSISYQFHQIRLKTLQKSAPISCRLLITLLCQLTVSQAHKTTIKLKGSSVNTLPNFITTDWKLCEILFAFLYPWTKMKIRVVQTSIKMLNISIYPHTMFERNCFISYFIPIRMHAEVKIVHVLSKEAVTSHTSVKSLTNHTWCQVVHFELLQHSSAIFIMIRCQELYDIFHHDPVW